MRRHVLWLTVVVMMLTAQGCAQHSSRSSTSNDSSDEKAAKIYSDLGLGYLRQGRLEMALNKLEQAIEHDRDYPAANLYIAEVYKQLSDVENADKFYGKAVKLDPMNPMVLNNYGAFLCDQARLDDAERYLVRAANTPRYDTPELAFENLALCALRSENKVKAEEYFRKALAIRPTLQKSLYRMALLKYEDGDYMRARAFLQRYHDVAPKSGNSLKQGIKIEEAMGNEVAVAEYQKQLRESFPQADDR